jgi:hypothetical protein
LPFAALLPAEGKPIVRSDPILRGLKALMAETGKIPPEYGAHSIRHAVFTAMLMQMSVDKVIQFSGHSWRSHTLEKFYYHLGQNHRRPPCLLFGRGRGRHALDACGAGDGEAFQEDDRRETELEGGDEEME